MAERLIPRLVGGRRGLAFAWSAVQLYGSRALGQAAGFAVSVLLARELGPEAFGLFAFTVTAALVLAELPGSGLDMASIRLSAQEGLVSPARAYGTLVLAGLTKGAAGLVVLSIGLPVADPLAELFHRPQLALGIRCALALAVALSLTEWAMAALLARQRFGWILLVSLALAGLRLGSMLALLVAGSTSLEPVLATYLAAAYAALALSVVVAWRACLGPAELTAALWRKLLGLGRWLIPATASGAAVAGLDVIALTHLAGGEATGVYAAGRTLALPISVAGGVIGGVLLPRLSRLTEPAEIARAIQRLAPRLVALTLAGGCAVAALAPLLVGVAYGARYAEAEPIFRLLVLAYGLEIVTWPLYVTLLVRSRPQVVAGLALSVVPVSVVCYAWLVPIAGAQGAAVGAVLARLAIIPPALLLTRHALSVQEVDAHSAQPALALDPAYGPGGVER